MNLQFAPLLSLLLLFPTLTLAHTPTDFSDDGISDLTYITINPSKTLIWQYRHSQNKKKTALSTLGKSGDHVAVAKWQAASHSFPGIIRRNTDDTVSWIIENDSTKVQSQISLGTADDLFIAGADVDGQGSADAIAVSITDDALIWKIRKNPFDGGPTTEDTITFGEDGDVPFFFSKDGTVDLLALLHTDSDTGAQTIITYNANTTAEETITLDTTVPSPHRPIAVKSETGEDALVLFTQGTVSTALYVFSLDGVLQRVISVKTVGELIVGEFLAQHAGEEIAIKEGLRFVPINPFNRKKSSIVLSAEIPVDEININSFKPWGSGSSDCTAEDPNDGIKRGFIWKPNSDTQHWAVAILPNRFIGTTAVSVHTLAGAKINDLKFKGNANPDDKGFRSHWIASSPYTGKKYFKDHGVVSLKVLLPNGSCSTYLLSTPQKRID